MEPKAKTPNKPAAVNFTSGLIVGTLVAAAANFLYKTEKGKKVRRQLQRHYREGKSQILELVETVKQQAENLSQSAETATDLSKAKKRLVKKAPLKPRVKKKTFLKAGRPLVK